MYLLLIDYKVYNYKGEHIGNIIDRYVVDPNNNFIAVVEYNNDLKSLKKEYLGKVFISKLNRKPYSKINYE